MPEPGGPGASSRADDAALRAHILASYELGMLANASNYDLRQRSERKRSVKDLESLFFGAVKDFGPDLFVEAGARDARSSRRARGLLPDARIVAFEANPFVYERFRSVNEAPRHRLEYLHCALSDAPGEVAFHVRYDSEGRPRTDGRGSLRRLADPTHEVRPVTVPCTTLDDFFGDHAVGSCALWIDVEGASQEVLQGGRALLSQAVLVFIEVEDRGNWKWGRSWTTSDVVEFLFDHGLVPVARDYQSRYQHNEVFVAVDGLRNHRLRARLATHRSGALHRANLGASEASPSAAARALRWGRRALRVRLRHVRERVARRRG